MTQSFVKACQNFFGRKPGQTLGEFAQEIKQLTQADRDELSVLLAEQLGEDVEPGVAPA